MFHKPYYINVSCGLIIGLSSLLQIGSVQAAQVNRMQMLMGTFCEIKAEGQPDIVLNQAITAAFAEIARLEQMLSTYRESSEVSRLNRGAAVSPQGCSPELFKIIERSLYYSVLSDGAFDISIYPLTEAARQFPLSKNSDHGNPFVINYKNIVMDSSLKSVFFKKAGMGMDFGALGKGYALDKALEVFLHQGMNQIEINFGGQILVHRSSATEVVVSSPNKSLPGVKDQRRGQRSMSSDSVLTMRLDKGSVSTSSQHERPGHIIDPRTGEAVSFDGSVTVVSPTATEADALSTILFVLGPEAGLAFLEREFPDSAAMFLIPNGGIWQRQESNNFKKFY